jgi:hypothetical protein
MKVRLLRGAQHKILPICMWLFRYATVNVGNSYAICNSSDLLLRVRAGNGGP